MLVGSSANSRNSRITKRAVVLVGFVFVFLLASVAIGLRTSNAALPYAKGCRGGGDGGEVTCTTTSSTVVTTSTISVTTTQQTSTSADTQTTTSSAPQVENSPIVPASPAVCTALSSLGYKVLAPGTQLTIAFNGNGKMTFTVPSQSFTWNWYLGSSWRCGSEHIGTADHKRHVGGWARTKPQLLRRFSQWPDWSGTPD